MKKKVKCPECGMVIRCWTDVYPEMIFDVVGEDTFSLCHIQNNSFGNERFGFKCNSCEGGVDNLTMGIDEPEILSLIEKILDARLN